MCKGTNTSQKSLLELQPSNISSETVSPASLGLIVINCLVWVHVFFSLADAVDCSSRTSQLRCGKWNTVVLWCESSYLEKLSKAEAARAFQARHGCKLLGFIPVSSMMDYHFLCMPWHMPECTRVGSQWPIQQPRYICKPAISAIVQKTLS